MTNPDATFLNGALCNDAPINDEAVSDSFVSNPPSGGTRLRFLKGSMFQRGVGEVRC